MMKLPAEFSLVAAVEKNEGKETWRRGRGEHEKIERSPKIITVFCVKGQQTELKAFPFHCSLEFGCISTRCYSPGSLAEQRVVILTETNIKRFLLESNQWAEFTLASDISYFALFCFSLAFNLSLEGQTISQSAFQVGVRYIFLFSRVFIPALGPAQSPIQ
jgi:hypothetical protein